MNFIKALCGVLLCYALQCELLCQTDSVLLKPAEVSALKIRTDNGLAMEELLLKSHKTVLKDYGPANITSVSMRGGNSSQVLVSWNGVELNDPMLGQLDMSLIQPSLFQNLEISSSIREFSGISGGINLVNEQIELENRKFGFEVSTKLKSFNSKEFNVSSFINQKNYSARISAFSINALNNYQFPSESDRKQVSHAAVNRKGILLNQHLGTKIGDFDWNIWLQDSFNEIPPTVVQNSSSAFQNDRFTRTQLIHKLKLKNLEVNSLVFANQNSNEYTDSLYLIFAENRFTRVSAQTEVHLQKEKWEWRAKVSSEQVTSHSQNYSEGRRRITHGVQASVKRDFKKLQLRSNLKLNSVDKKVFSAFQFFGDYDFNEQIRLFGGISKTFRIPTFNDLYWTPGGNQNLKPEEALAAELGFKARLTASRVYFSSETSVYLRNTKNWILWALNPDANFWGAQNANEVLSKGIETLIKGTYEINQESRLTLQTEGQLIDSRFMESMTLPAISEGEQMYYVPHFSMSSSASWTMNSTSLSYGVNLRSFQEGVLYTMDGFSVHECSIQRKLSMQKVNLTVNFSAKNIFNTRYEMVEYRPLPGRYYELSINLKSK